MVAERNLETAEQRLSELESKKVKTTPIPLMAQ